MRKLQKSELKRVYGASNGKGNADKGNHYGYEDGDVITVPDLADDDAPSFASEGDFLP